MSLIDKARVDWQRFTSNSNEFGVAITLLNPSETVSLAITGLAMKHHIGIDTEGNLVNTKNAHITFSEKLVTDLSESFRDVNGEVNLHGWKCEWADSTGIIKKYIINEWFQDETVGVITCILGDFEV